MNMAVAIVENSLTARAQRVAAIAASHADAVDHEARFPREAVDAMRAEKLLSVQIPVSLDGEAASITETRFRYDASSVEIGEWVMRKIPLRAAAEIPAGVSLRQSPRRSASGQRRSTACCM